MTSAAAISRDHPETLFATPSIVADRRADGSICCDRPCRSATARAASATGWSIGRARRRSGFFSASAAMPTRRGPRSLTGMRSKRPVGCGLDSGARAERGPSPRHSRRQQRRSRAVGAGGDACRRALGRDLAGLFADVPGLRQAQEHDRPAGARRDLCFRHKAVRGGTRRDQAAASAKIVSGNADDADAISFRSVAATPETPDVAKAFAAVTPDTIAKFLFTSGSTGTPKAVINTQRMLTSSQQAKAQTWTFLEARATIS